MYSKSSLIREIRLHGDVALVLRPDRRDIVVTTDFSTPYIKNNFKKQHFKVGGMLTVFSWTDNKFVQVDPAMVESIQPLASILNNGE